MKFELFELYCHIEVHELLTSILFSKRRSITFHPL